MLPASITISSLLTDASTVVSQFGGLIGLVVALAFGFFVVRFLISKLKRAGQQ